MRRGQPTRWARGAVVAATLILGAAGSAAADSWNDRVELRFSEPVMVPGATLQPGKYVFQLADSQSTRHMVEIRSQDGGRVILTQAVPVKRTDPKGDIVMTFNPTDAGSPPAIKSWYYPGSVYGHQFIYPQEQARKIAERTRTIVLGVDVPGTDLQKGELHAYDASGGTRQFRGDETTEREWNEWRRSRAATGETSNQGAPAERRASREERRQANAPMMESDFQGMRVKLDDLEDNPRKYIGKKISVDAEVEDVHGPRLFTIDEVNWGDLAGEILVYMPSDLAAMVRENDRVTVTGTVKPFVRAEIEREWGWLDLDPGVEVDFSRKPVLVASRIVGGNNDLAMVIDAVPAGSEAVGTSGSAEPTPITELSQLTGGDEDLVGRHVQLNGLKVESKAKGGGFFASGREGTLFILPSNRQQQSESGDVHPGDIVSVKGVVLEMPRKIRDRLNEPKANDEIYVYATNLTK